MTRRRRRLGSIRHRKSVPQTFELPCIDSRYPILPVDVEPDTRAAAEVVAYATAISRHVVDAVSDRHDRPGAIAITELLGPRANDAIDLSDEQLTDRNGRAAQQVVRLIDVIRVLHVARAGHSEGRAPTRDIRHVHRHRHSLIARHSRRHEREVLIPDRGGAADEPKWIERDGAEQ